MLKMYIKTAWRSLVVNRVFSALNVFGLAAGMAIALIIGLWINEERSYDRWLVIPGILTTCSGDADHPFGGSAGSSL